MLLRACGFVLLLTLQFPSFSQIGFCGMDQYMQEHFDSHPDADAEYVQEQLELTMRARLLQGAYDNPNRNAGGGCGMAPLILNENSFVIPVVFHILYSNDGNLAQEDVSYTQIISAINQLNQDFDCFNGYNMELSIRFELAQTPPDQGWSDPSEPGVMRLQTSQSSTTLVNGDALLNLGLPTLSEFPSSNYLNIVSSPFQMLSWGVAYSNFAPQANVFTGECNGVESFIGIIGELIGNPLDDDGSFTTIQNANFNVAGVLAHEVGHHFDLRHVGSSFPTECGGSTDGSCDIEGDFVCDTPPETGLSSSNQSGPLFVNGVDVGNTCNESVDYTAFYANLGVAQPPLFTAFPIGAPLAGATDMYDQVENIMRSGGPSLQFFTPGQFNRMHAAILLNYPDLSSWASLVQAGVPNTIPAVLAQIEADFDACTGITTFSCPEDLGNLINVNPAYTWTVNGVVVNNGNTFGITLPPGDNNVLLQVDDIPCPLQFLAEDEVVLSVGNCNDNCSLVCNGGFEASNGNFTIPSVDVEVSAGVLQDNCTSGVEQLACWNSAGFAHLVQDGFPDCDFTWGSDPLGGTIPAYPNMPMPECSEFLNNEHFIRVSDVFNSEENLLGGVNTQLTSPLIAGQDYILEFDWAYRTNMTVNDLMNYEIQLGFGNILCDVLPTGGFVGGQNDLSFIPATVVQTNTWNHRVVEFTANLGNGGFNDDVLYVSMIRNGAQDYSFNLSLDNVRVIPVNDNPVAIDITVTPICDGGALTYQVDVTATLFGPAATFNLDLNIHENTGPNYNLLQTQNIQFNQANFVNSEQTVGFVLPDLGVFSSLIMPEAPPGMCLVDTSPLKFEATEDNYQVRVTHASCNGGDGEVVIDFLPNGATATLEDLGTGTLTSIPFGGLQGLQDGLYDVQITTQVGCTFTHPIEILSFADYNLNVVVDDACSNEANGSAEADPTFAGLIQTFEQTPVFGEALTTTYAWTDALLDPVGFNTPIVSGLTPGAYNVTTSVGVNSILLNQLLAQNNMTNLTIPDGQGNQVVLHGTAGEVTYAVPDCIQTASFVVGNTVNPAPTINPVAADCVNQIPGQINVTNAAGWNTFLIGDDGVLLQQGIGNTNYPNLPGAIYTIIGDLNGCSFVQQVDLVDPAAVPPVIAPAIFTNFCGLQALGGGQIDMAVTGNAPFDFVWIVGGGITFAGEDLPDAAPNSTYGYSVVDACGLTTTINVTTPQGDFALFNGSTVTNSPCGLNAGQINLQVASVFNQMANPPLFFEWTGPNGFTSNAQNIFNLAPGTYVVEVSAANSTCTFSESFDVLSDGLAPAFTAQTMYDCTVTPTTPNTIEVTILAPDAAPVGEWLDDQGNIVVGNVNGGLYTLANIPDGTYTFVYQDAATCFTEDFTVPEIVQADYSYDISINCLGGQNPNPQNPATIDLEVFYGDGTGMVIWTDAGGNVVSGIQSGDVFSIVDVPTGDYTFTYSDNTSCFSETVNTNAATFTMETTYDCNGVWGSNGVFSLTVENPSANTQILGGNLQFVQNGNTFTADQLPNMTQVFLYSDDDNCFLETIVLDYIPPSLNSTLIAPCQGQQNGIIQITDLSLNPDVVSIDVCEGQFNGVVFNQSGVLTGVPSTIAGFEDYSGVDESFDYLIKMTLQNGCVIEESFQNIVAETGGCCFPTTISNVEGVECGSYTFSISCDEGGTVNWDFGDGNTATGTTVDHQFCSNGNHTVTAEIEEGGVIVNTVSLNLTVSLCVFLEIVSSVLNDNLCAEFCDASQQIVLSDDHLLFIDGVQFGGLSNIHNFSRCPGLYELQFIQEGTGCVLTENLLIESVSTSHPGYIIDSDEDLTDLLGEHYFSEDVVVTDEATLNMNGSNWYFSNGSSLIIEEGSVLEVDSITLTSCASTWNGINVKADAATQTEEGSLRLFNSTIEHASVGISSFPLNWLGNFNSANVPTWRSGKVYCDGVTFLNNRLGVRLSSSSHLNDASVGFVESDFLVNDDFRFASNFTAHVYYQNILGYDFTDCTFKNEMEDLSQLWSQRGVGIRFYNANFTLNNEVILDEVDPFGAAHFEGLRFGIQGMGREKPWWGMRVLNASFDQNEVGIWTNNVYFHTIANNFMRVGQPSADLDLNTEEEYEGIVITGGTGFAVAQNTIEGIDVGSCDDCTFGIRVRDTRTIDDVIYFNTFNNLNNANLANGDNAHPSGPELGGLRYVCNQNSNNRVDFRVSDFTTGMGGFDLNIARFQFGTDAQGNPNNSAAGNTFSAGLNTDWHFWNFGDQILYFPGNSSDETPTLTIPFSVDVQAPVLDNGCGPFEMIVSNEGDWDLSELNQLKSDLIQSEQDYESGKFLWLSLIDDGDTPALQDEVDGAWPEDTWTMRDRLLSISPKVSSTVLYEMLDNTVVYPHPVALEIILANPDIARDNRFIDYLEAKPDPMPSYMVDLIYAARDQVTFRTVLEMQLSQAKATYLQQAFLLTRAYYADGDSLNSALDFQNELDIFSLELSESLQLVQEGLSSSSILDSIGLHFDPKFKSSEEYFQLKKLLELDESIQLDGRLWHELLAPEVEELRDIADYFWTFAGREAMNALNFFYDEVYFIPPALNSSWTPRSMTANPLSTIKDEVLVFPNPANQLVNVQLNLKAGNVPTKLYIYTNDGSLVYQERLTYNKQYLTLNTSNWTSGTYNWSVETIKETITGKLTITH